MQVKTGLYQHFKGNYYKVLGLAHHSETEEPLVIYQALYGAKGMWVRPYEMFFEIIERGGESTSRFAYCEKQTQILEMAVLPVIEGKQTEFEQTFNEAQKIIASMPGYISHRLERCIENANHYLLLVEWQTLEDHTVGFRGSKEYQRWKELLHHFYSPFPEVLHFKAV